MIYQGENSFMVDCNCRCGEAIKFDVLDDQVFISCLESLDIEDDGEREINKSYFSLYELDEGSGICVKSKEKIKEMMGLFCNSPIS